MKIVKNIMFILIIMMLIFVSYCNVSYAAPQATITQEGGTSITRDPLDNPDFYNPSKSEMGENEKFIEKANIILTIIQVLGTIIAVISLIAIGIRYMFGSTQEKAMYKETMIPYIIGAIMLFAIPNILKVIVDLVQSVKL